MKFHPKVISALALVVFMSACATVPQTPAQTIFALKASEAAGLVIANSYKALPTCPVQAPICKTQNVVDSVIKSDHVAAAAIDQAEVLVRDPTFKDGNIVQKAIEAAKTSITAFISITSSLKVR